MKSPVVTRATVSTPGERDIRIERIFNAPRDRVWRALTNPALVAQWWGRAAKNPAVSSDAFNPPK